MEIKPMMSISRTTAAAILLAAMVVLSGGVTPAAHHSATDGDVAGDTHNGAEDGLVVAWSVGWST